MRFNCAAAKTNSAQKNTTNATTNCRESTPAGSARMRVRGLAASITWSASRLNAMAADRAATIATTIQASWRGPGHPRAASMAAESANGSANTECSHLIISRVTRRLRVRVTVKFYAMRSAFSAPNTHVEAEHTELIAHRDNRDIAVDVVLHLDDLLLRLGHVRDVRDSHVVGNLLLDGDARAGIADGCRDFWRNLHPADAEQPLHPVAQGGIQRLAQDLV